VYTDSKHNNPLCRLTLIENMKSMPQYDKERYKEMILDAAETILGFFDFDRTVYGIPKWTNEEKRRYEELREQRVKTRKQRCF
jgi:hypothetical protein